MSNRFAFETPKQALWFTHPQHGVTFQVPIICEEAPVKKRGKQWLQWAA